MIDNIWLFIFGLLGIFLHNLVKMDSLNRAGNGKINYLQYLAVERFGIIISIIVVGLCVAFKNEIAGLAVFGHTVAAKITIVPIGYMAQSLLVKVMALIQERVDSRKKL